MKRSDYLGGAVSNFNRLPHVRVPNDDGVLAVGWRAVWETVLTSVASEDTTAGAERGVTVAVETYQGVDMAPLVASVPAHWKGYAVRVVDTHGCMKGADEVAGMVYPDVTDDRVFGYMTRRTLSDFFPPGARGSLAPAHRDEILIIVGPGATLLGEAIDRVVYADMPRWEIQQRQRAGRVANMGVANAGDDPKALYKQSFFVDWRVLDRHKRRVLPQSDWYLESVDPDQPQILATASIIHGLEEASARPFSPKPFFDPGVWGGHWMEEVCDLDRDKPNHAWCFNCVPEENSMLLAFGERVVEVPAINLVLFRTRALLGDPVHARFGAEFPIRFDLLDTMGGQNLSFQVHPLTEYIQEHFGVPYTQDESYYILDAEPGAVVYLGLKEGVDPEAMRGDLDAAQGGGEPFPAERHVQTWPARKHDHFLIPAGTPHCSGANAMVLEISATPYIFTFKLWDWGRIDLDGSPRPINIEHGWPNIQWERTTSWTERELVNRFEEVAAGAGWREERTGLHRREFIETRRHRFSAPVEQDTGGVAAGSVHVLTLVEGREATVESPEGAFAPFVVHYAETFVVPAAVGRYRMRPTGESAGETVVTVRASVRV